MAEHTAPLSLLERWNQTEPLRLHLYGITVPLLGAAVVYGWMTMEQMGAWLAVAAALFIGSTVAGELARRKVTSPATVDAWLDQVHEASYHQGVHDALDRTPDLVAAQTAQMHSVRPSERCRYIENGRRCVLDPHEDKEMPHHYG
jgi:hypothetical protein